VVQLHFQSEHWLEVLVEIVDNLLEPSDPHTGIEDSLSDSHAVRRNHLAHANPVVEFTQQLDYFSVWNLSVFQDVSSF
jgi:hypothetical protein